MLARVLASPSHLCFWWHLKGCAKESPRKFGERKTRGICAPVPLWEGNCFTGYTVTTGGMTAAQRKTKENLYGTKKPYLLHCLVFILLNFNPSSQTGQLRFDWFGECPCGPGVESTCGLAKDCCRYAWFSLPSVPD